MRSKTYTVLAAAIAVAGASLFTATTAEALALRLTSGACVQTINDADADGVVQFNGACGDFNVNATTGLSDPVLAQPFPHMDLNSVNTNSTTSPANLTIQLTDNGFTGLAAQIMNDIGGTVADTGTLRARLYGSDTNNEFAEDVLLWDSGVFGAGAFAATAQAGTLFASEPWSVTMRIDIFHERTGDATSFDWEIQRVPEPFSLSLLALGLLGMGVTARRRG